MYAIAEITPWEDLERAVRQTTLLGQDIEPYADARISLEAVSYDRTLSTSLYVARTLLAHQSDIAKAIAPEGFDPLDLEHGLVLSSVTAGNGETLTGYVPPIVEVFDDVQYVLDGSHRANRGRWMGRTAFNAIVVRGIRDDCPPYARPNEWNEVVMYEKPPQEPRLRKRYNGDYAKGKPQQLYRDFSPLNGSTLRYPNG